MVSVMSGIGARYPWSPNSAHQAKAIMVFNLAATHAMRGEHEKALQHLGKVFVDSVCVLLRIKGLPLDFRVQGQIPAHCFLGLHVSPVEADRFLHLEKMIHCKVILSDFLKMTAFVSIQCLLFYLFSCVHCAFLHLI